MDTQEYTDAGLTHLNDDKVYQHLPLGQYTKQLGIYLNETYKEWLTDKTITYSTYKKLRRNPDKLPTKPTKTQAPQKLHPEHKTTPLNKSFPTSPTS